MLAVSEGPKALPMSLVVDNASVDCELDCADARFLVSDCFCLDSSIAVVVVCVDCAPDLFETSDACSVDDVCCVA